MPTAVCPPHSRQTVFSRQHLMSAMAPRPQMAPLHSLNKTQIPPTRPFGGWPLPLPLTLPARLPLIKYSGHTDLFVLHHSLLISTLELCSCACLKCSAPGYFQPSRPSGLCSTLASSRRPYLAALYSRSPPPAPVLYSLPCFIFLQSTSHHLLRHHSLC